MRTLTVSNTLTTAALDVVHKEAPAGAAFAVLLLAQGRLVLSHFEGADGKVMTDECSPFVDVVLSAVAPCDMECRVDTIVLGDTYTVQLRSV